MRRYLEDLLQMTDEEKISSVEEGKVYYSREREAKFIITQVNDTDHGVVVRYERCRHSLDSVVTSQGRDPYVYEVSQTEPDMSYTPKEIIANFMRGRPMNLSQNQEYDTDVYKSTNEMQLHHLNVFEDEFEAMAYAKAKDEEMRRQKESEKRKKKEEKKESVESPPEEVKKE